VVRYFRHREGKRKTRFGTGYKTATALLGQRTTAFCAVTESDYFKIASKQGRLNMVRGRFGWYFTKLLTCCERSET
jgi:hypothetical protein